MEFLHQSVHGELLPTVLAHPWTWWISVADAEFRGTARWRCKRKNRFWVKKEKHQGRSTWTWCSRWHLGFILAPGRIAGASLSQSRRWRYRSCGGSLVLTTARTVIALFLHWGANVQARFNCIGHGDRCQERKTLDGVRKKETMRQRKALMKELGFFTLAKRALFISTY
jgi:hypothetical protein